MSSLSYVISALPLLVKFGTKEMKTNKIACMRTTFSVPRPMRTCAHGFEGADGDILSTWLKFEF